MDSPEAAIRQRALSRGCRASLGVAALVALGGAIAALGALQHLGEAFGGIFHPASGCAGCRATPGALVMRGADTVAAIRQLADPGVGRPLALFLAPAEGPVADSLRRRLLAARLGPVAHTGNWLIEVLPLDSVAGLKPAARLVVAPGEPSLPIYGEWVRPPRR